MKKHKNYKPQRRGKLKTTVGQMVMRDITYLDREPYVTDDGETIKRVYATCTCGNWRSSEDADTVLKVGREAQAHVESSETCILRPHTDDPIETVAGE